ncbi:hypothetical protein [Salinithrix halophila]
MSQTTNSNHEENQDNDLLDMIKGSALFTGLFMGIALVGAVLAILLK